MKKRDCFMSKIKSVGVIIGATLSFCFCSTVLNLSMAFAVEEIWGMVIMKVLQILPNVIRRQ